MLNQERERRKGETKETMYQACHTQSTNVHCFGSSLQLLVELRYFGSTSQLTMIKLVFDSSFVCFESLAVCSLEVILV